MNLERKTREYREFIESYLKDYYDQFHDEPQNKLFEAMEYSLLGGGKRLRPIFTFAFCQMCGKNWKQAAPFAAAIEMIQTYSLIHDDLPAMDNDDFRRGRPTNHKVYGEAMAILAGDALLSDAFTMAVKNEVTDLESLRTAIGILSECIGSLGMVGGQVLDMESGIRELTEEEVLAIQSRKTGCLISAACCLGVIAGGGTEEQLNAAAQFAAGIGLAFQIRDDMLDVIGTQEEMGKGVGTDAAKNTFVRLYGLEKCEQLVQTYTDYALKALSVFEDSAYLKALARSLTERRV